MAKSPNGPKTVVIDGEEFETASFESGGKTYTMRELSVKESDDISDASKDEKGGFNGRLNMRLAITTATIDPKITVEDMDRWPSKRYVLAMRTFDKLNTLPEDSSGKDSAPETSSV